MTTTVQQSSRVTVPPVPYRSRALARTVGRALRLLLARMPIRVRFPDSSVTGGGDPASPLLLAVRPDDLALRLAHHPSIGLGEAYMAGDWATARGSDLADAMVPFADLLTRRMTPLFTVAKVFDRHSPFQRRNDPTGARENIADHYDLGNDLFEAFLDETMTYSSALFDDTRPWAEQTLAEAQRRKIDAILDAAQVGPGTTVLEIGTGWGELALRAAARGATVTSLTLSTEQLALATERVEAAGLADRVDIRLQDYRHATGTYDAVVSVEMIEAVGAEFLPVYFQTIHDRLRPGGRAAIQAILTSDAHFDLTKDGVSWISRYIFPGGLVPSLAAITAALPAGLALSGDVRFGAHYAETLRRWRRTFTDAWPGLADSYGETFRRMWEFYLAYAETGFRSGILDVSRLTFTRA